MAVVATRRDPGQGRPPQSAVDPGKLMARLRETGTFVVSVRRQLPCRSRALVQLVLPRGGGVAGWKSDRMRGQL